MKKGFIRSIEAVIAVVLFLMFFYTVFDSPIEKLDLPSPLQDSLKFVVNKVLYNETLREAVLVEDHTLLGLFLSENIQPAYKYSYVICQKANCICKLPDCQTEEPPPNKEIFIDDVYITSTYTFQEPKIFRVYAWKD